MLRRGILLLFAYAYRKRYFFETYLKSTYLYLWMLEYFPESIFMSEESTNGIVYQKLSKLRSNMEILSRSNNSIFLENVYSIVARFLSLAKVRNPGILRYFLRILNTKVFYTSWICIGKNEKTKVIDIRS